MKLISEVIGGSAMPGARREVASQICQVAVRIGDQCTVCGERLAHKTCESCERRMCNVCAIFSTILPYSFFCSEDCRDEAELAAEQVRQSDAYQRW